MDKKKNVCRKLFLHLFLLVVLSVINPLMIAAQTPLTDSTFQRLDSYIESILEETGIPGAAVAVVHNSQIVYQKGYGVSGPQNEPVTPETPMILGSVSKSITALAIMQLVEDGLIELDASIGQYFPDIQTESTITIRHLLTHTSRYSSRKGRELIGIGNRSSSALTTRAHQLLEDVPATDEIGIKFEYSNSNYNLLGAIIEQTSGKSYEDYIEQEIFEPLKMERSFASFSEPQKHGIATGYRYIFGIPTSYKDFKYNKALIPSGNLVSTANDMGNYISALLNRGSTDSTELLGASHVEDMFTAYQDNISYGFGWQIGQRDNVKVIHHDGATANFSTHVWMVPDEDWGAVILFNAMTYISGPDIGSIKNGVGRILAGKEGTSVENAPYHYVLKILIALFVFQILGAIHSGLLIHRWRKSNNLISRFTVWGRLWHIWLPLAINSLLIVFYLYGLPKLFDMTLQGMIVFAPDVAYLLFAGAGFAIIWSLFRTIKYRKLLMTKHAMG